MVLSLRRTVARSQQLEAEERKNARRSANRRTPGFLDEPNEHTDAATLLRDDQIDFLDHDGGREVYRDELTNDEDDVFMYADADDEDAIGLDQQPPRK